MILAVVHSSSLLCVRLLSACQPDHLSDRRVMLWFNSLDWQSVKKRFLLSSRGFSIAYYLKGNTVICQPGPDILTFLGQSDK